MDKNTQGSADWRLLLRLVKMVRSSSKMLLPVLTLIPIGIGLSVLQPYLLKLTIDQGIEGHDPERLLHLSILYVVAILVGFLITTIGEYGLQSIGMKQHPYFQCIFYGSPIPIQPPSYLGLYVNHFVYFSTSDASERNLNN